MSEELGDELTSINSIYGFDVLAESEHSSRIYVLSLPPQRDIQLRIEFPADYPSASPSILGTQSVGSTTAKGEGANLVDVVRDVLAEIFTPGTPCLFDLIEEVDQRLQQFESDPVPSQQAVQGADEQHCIPVETSRLSEPTSEEEPPWVVSEVITEKKSVFISRAAHVTSVAQAQTFLAHLLTTDKKVAKATHNITAWRIRRADGVQFQDYDDDGEAAAGGRLLHLMELMGAWNAMVVVTRWYGGIHLGSDRFRIINQCARDVIIKCRFAAQEDLNEGGKKKGKK